MMNSNSNDMDMFGADDDIYHHNGNGNGNDHHPSYNELDDSHGNGSKQSEGSSTNGSSTLVRRETRQVKQIRKITFWLIVITTIAVGYGIFHIIRKGQIDNFQTDFHDLSVKIVDSFHWQLERKLAVMDSLAINIISEVKHKNQTWPNIVVSDYHIKASTTRNLAKAASIALLPMVNKETRKSWETFASTPSNQKWIQDGYDFEHRADIKLGGEGQGTTGTGTGTGTTEQQGEEEGSETAAAAAGGDEQLVQQAKDNELDGPAEQDVDTSAFHAFYGGDHGRNRNRNRNLNLANGNVDTVITHYVEEEHEVIPYDYNQDGPFFPLWQSSPILPELVNMDLLDMPDFHDGIQQMLDSKEAVIGKVSDLGRDRNDIMETLEDHWDETSSNSQFYYKGEPFSKMYFPIYAGLHVENNDDDDTNDKRDIVGMLTAVVFWETYLQNVLAPHTPPVDVVLENECGQSYTYEVIGQDAIYLGYGDVHQSKYEHMKESSNVIAYLGLQESIERYRGIPLNDYCHYTLHIYPTKDLEDAHLTNLPFYFTGCTTMIFLFVMFMIRCYDWCVDKRQESVMAKAKQASAIVSSLFPKEIQERLYNNGGGDKMANDNETRKSMLTFAEPQKLKLKNFLTNNKTGGPQGETSNSDEQNNKAVNPASISMGGPSNGSVTTPSGAAMGAAGIVGVNHLADTFPETTILFADIVGFSAWSSQREPTQIFMLLQTLYHSFDMIARRLSVFKVETVGDCYVAATGLPQPQSDHPLRMSRFARLIMDKMGELTSGLEIKLGPDTGDLKLRVGLHSGKVTAGVLRGEKARFQLFGDTVNTASRMESNGAPNRIHCSEATAQLLIDAGKEHWVSMRQDMINAKGKGRIVTYWVMPRSGPSFVDECSDVESEAFSDDGTEDLSEISSVDMNSPFWADTKVVYDLGIESSRQQRLVEWNVTLLARYLKQIAAWRKDLGANYGAKTSKLPHHSVGSHGSNGADSLKLRHKEGSTALDEVTEVIELPTFDESKASKLKTRPDSIELDDMVYLELKDYVTTIASMYRDNSFHNFEHASHVSQSTSKLLKRIVLSDDQEDLASAKVSIIDLHQYSHGLATDPLAQFALVYCALIHDVDHPGVPNFTLVSEKTSLARFYKKSIAEQNSVDLAWDLLMDDSYQHLQKAIFGSHEELKRFRQLVVNIILATDIFDKDMKAIRETRWDKAFHQYNEKPEGPADDSKSVSTASTSKSGAGLSTVINLKATVVIEHLIQASDVSHTMQHYDIYLKWNERLFGEMYAAFEAGRSNKDPSKGWVEGEIWFFDRYIIPLAKKLAECGVFGVASDEYLNYALENRKQLASSWSKEGDKLVEGFLQRYKENKKENKKNKKTQRKPSTISADFDAIEESDDEMSAA